MDRELEREMDGATDREPWILVVSEAAPCEHIVQLYQDQDFLDGAVCRFAGAALANGEGIILVPTLDHWNAIRPRLEGEGVDVEAAQKRGQLTVVDADELLPRFMRNAMPDAPVFLGRACGRHRDGHASGLSESALVGRNGQCPVGAWRRRRQHGPRGPLRPARSQARYRDLLLVSHGQL